MKRPARLVAPLLLVALLSGCAVAPAGQGSNPLQDLVDIIPWAKSVAADATAEEVTARIAEISAQLPTLDIPEGTRTELEAKLKALAAAIRAEPGNVAAHIAAANEVIDDIKAAID